MVTLAQPPAPAKPAAFNDGVTQPDVLRPRLRVLFSGIEEAPTKRADDGRRDRAAYQQPPSGKAELPGPWSADIEMRNWYQGSRFTIEAPLHASPSFGLGFWARQRNGLMAEVQMSLRDGDWRTVVQGEVDRVEAHPSTGYVTLEGRDLTSRFIETKTQEAFQNQTASEIVEILAARHGMRAVVTRTTTPVRAYWDRDHVHVAFDEFSRATTEWDLMVSLAQFEDFDLFVQGETVYFRPATTETGPPFVVRWQPPNIADRISYGRESNVIDLRLARALTLAKDIEVQVKSWNSRTGTSFIRTARAIGAKSAAAARAAVQVGTATQRFVFVRPNLTQAEAQRYANHQLRVISEFERLVSFKMPGDLRLTTRTKIRMEGTGSDWDQDYWPDSISLNLTFDGGLTMAVSAKNRDARSEVVLR